jgi:sialate O-acetylesterase
MPLPLSARLRADRVEVTFSGIEGGLHAWSGPPLGIELCGDTQESCRYAAAQVSGDRLLVRTDGRPASRVRHAWADSPLVNLHDARPLPVPTFELPIAR